MTDPDDSIRLGITTRNGVTIQDRHQALGELPEVDAAIREWIDDPAPKLRGLRLQVRKGAFELELSMSVERSGIAFRRTVLVGNPCEQSDYRRWHAALQLRDGHFALVNDLRKAIAAGQIAVEA